MNLLQLSNDVILHAAKPSLTFVFFLILKQQGGAASEMEMDRLKFDYKRSMQMFKRQKKMYEDLYQCFVNELLEEGAEAGDPNRKAAWDAAVIFSQSALKFKGTVTIWS